MLAFLERREELWTREFVEAGAESRGGTPEEQLLAIFDVFDEWFQPRGLRGVLIHQRAARDGAEHPAGQRQRASSREHPLDRRRLAEEAGLRDPASFARSWHILMKGSIVSAAEGDVDAARRAQSMARLLIEEHR